MLRMIILALAGAALACGGGNAPTGGGERLTAAETWTPTPTPAPAATWTPTPKPAKRAISLECEFAMRSWDNAPLLAVRALDTNPADLTDEERGLWRKYLGGDYAKACAELWSVPAVDAPDKRNDAFAGACHHALTRSAVEAYRSEWLESGEYYQREVDDVSGAVWNAPDENPGLLAMLMLDLPYAPAASWDESAHSGLLRYLANSEREECRLWYPQIDGDRWYPVNDLTPQRNPYGTPYPKPTPTPPGYERGLTAPDEAQIYSARELDSQPG